MNNVHCIIIPFYMCMSLWIHAKLIIIFLCRLSHETLIIITITIKKNREKYLTVPTMSLDVHVHKAITNM